MPWYRAYVDKAITAKGGGEHARIIDGEAESVEDFEKSLSLKKSEALGQIVELADSSQAHEA